VRKYKTLSRLWMFWALTLYSSVGGCIHFRGTRCLLFQSWSLHVQKQAWYYWQDTGTFNENWTV
jgi:hypothetical protein